MNIIKRLFILLITLCCGSWSWLSAQKFKVEREYLWDNREFKVTLPVLLPEVGTGKTYAVRSTHELLDSVRIDLTRVGLTPTSPELADYIIELRLDREPHLDVYPDRYTPPKDAKGLMKLAGLVEAEKDYRLQIEYYFDASVHLFDKAGKKLASIQTNSIENPMKAWARSVGFADEMKAEVTLNRAEAIRSTSAEASIRVGNNRRTSIYQSALTYTSWHAQLYMEKVLLTLFGKVVMSYFLDNKVAPKVAKDFPREAALSEQMHQAHKAWTQNPKNEELRLRLLRLSSEFDKGLMECLNNDKASKALKFFYLYNYCLSALLGGTLNPGNLPLSDIFDEMPTFRITSKADEREQIDDIYNTFSLYEALESVRDYPDTEIDATPALRSPRHFPIRPYTAKQIYPATGN